PGNDAYSVVKVPLLAAMASRAGPRGIEPRPRRFWRPAGHHDLDPAKGCRRLRPGKEVPRRTRPPVAPYGPGITRGGICRVARRGPACASDAGRARDRRA